MYNPLLDTLITVADCGSFSKAAEKLFISPTAVMKQMNTLENHLNLTLIDRTSSGIRLTAAGKIIYNRAKDIKRFSQQAVSEAFAASCAEGKVFRVGTSLLCPSERFLELWDQYGSQFPGYRIHLIPFDDDHRRILEETSEIGTKYDFIVSVFDNPDRKAVCDFLPLGTYRKFVSIVQDHPLARKERLNIEDMFGCTLLMTPRGISPVNDRIREDLTRDYPQITIEDTVPHYDMSVFNQCAETGKLLLTTQCWKGVHPQLVTIPVNWPYVIPYGLLYSKKAQKDVLRFVDTVAKGLGKEP